MRVCIVIFVCVYEILESKEKLGIKLEIKALQLAVILMERETVYCRL